MIRRIRTLIRWFVVAQLVFVIATRVAQALLPSRGGEDDDEFERSVVGGGVEFSSRAGALRRGAVVTVLGGSSLDLTGATPAAGGADLSLFVVMGGVEVTVPAGWRVVVQRRVTAGEVEVQTPDPRSLPFDAPELRVDATVYVGGVAIGPEPKLVLAAPGPAAS